jgi:hypothetical protein
VKKYLTASELRLAAPESLQATKKRKAQASSAKLLKPQAASFKPQA